MGLQDGKTRRAMYVQLNIEVHSRYHFCSGRAVIITYSECVSVASVIQHPTLIRRIIGPPAARQAASYFSTYLESGTISGEKSQ